MSHLVIELLAHSDPDQAIEIAKTNQALQKVVSRTLGERNQWYFKDFRGFLEVYYTSILTPKAIKYLSPRHCFAWALREGNLEFAETFFQYWLIVEPDLLTQQKRASTGLYSDACLSRRPEVLDWLVQHYKAYFPRKTPILYFQDIYSAIRSGNVFILQTILTLIHKPPVNVDADLLIYYACLSNDLEIFKYVTSHFDLEGSNKIAIDKSNHLRIRDNVVENVLDWDLVYTCALNTKAGNILKMIEAEQINVQYVRTSEIPINPEVYKLYPNVILDNLHQDTDLQEFFGLVESNLDGRGPPDRYEVLKELDKLIQTSNSLTVVEFRSQIITQAISAGFVNIANFFRDRNYPVSRPLWEDETSFMFDEVPKDPVHQYWYRNSLLLTPKSHLGFRTYSISYHRLESDRDSFIPHGVSINWLVDQLLLFEELTIFDLKSIMDVLQEDHRFDPTYRLFDLLNLINPFRYVGQFADIANKIFKTVLSDPRIDLENSTLEELVGHEIHDMSEGTLMSTHLRKDLTPSEKLSEMKKSHSIDVTFEFEKYYLMSPEDLAQNLNSFQVPWIPHFNSLVAALFLSGLYTFDDFGTGKSNRIAPVSTLLRINNVITIMTVKNLYDEMIPQDDDD